MSGILKCARADCPADASAFSNFCPWHAPSLRNREESPSLFLIVAAIIIASLLAIAVGKIALDRSMQTSVRTSRCPLPEDEQQLLIAVAKTSTHVAVECVYVGSRGTYGTNRK